MPINKQRQRALNTRKIVVCMFNFRCTLKTYCMLFILILISFEKNRLVFWVLVLGRQYYKKQLSFPMQKRKSVSGPNIGAHYSGSPSAPVLHQLIFNPKKVKHSSGFIHSCNSSSLPKVKSASSGDTNTAFREAKSSDYLLVVLNNLWKGLTSLWWTR